MASSVLCGQAGLLGLPSVQNDGKVSLSSLADAKVRNSLRADRKMLKMDPSVGMEVYKISKVGCLRFYIILVGIYMNRGYSICPVIEG